MENMKGALEALRRIAGLEQESEEVNPDQEYFDQLRAKKDVRVEDIKENRVESFEEMLDMKDKVESMSDERLPEERRKALAREMQRKQKQELGIK